MYLYPKSFASTVPPKKKTAPLILTLFVLGLLAWGLILKLDLFPRTSCKESAFLMNTPVEVEVYGEGARERARAALKEIKRVEGRLSRFDPKSEVSVINHMAGITPVSVSSDTYEIIDRSLKLSRSFQGTFDITIGPLMELWQSKIKEQKRAPYPSEINQILPLVDFKSVELNPEKKTVKLPKKGMQIDLGGVAKGYGVACARNVLVNQKVKSALINTRSSLAVIGKRPGGKPWRVGLANPQKRGEILGIITLNPGQALSTSGGYERYFEAEGKRYPQILDPRTGYPASLCQSVTIVADDATVADFLSTTVFVLGPGKGMELIESLEGIKGIIVTESGAVLTSSGFKLEND